MNCALSWRSPAWGPKSTILSAALATRAGRLRVQGRRFPGERATGQGSSGAAHIRRADRGRDHHGCGPDPRVLPARIATSTRRLSMRISTGSLAALLAGAILCSAADDLAPIPQTPKKPVTDEYQELPLSMTIAGWSRPPTRRSASGATSKTPAPALISIAWRTAPLSSSVSIN